MSSTAENTSSQPSTVEDTSTPPTVYSFNTSPPTSSPYLFYEDGLVNLKEIIRLSRVAAKALVSYNPSVHTLLDYKDEDEKNLANTVVSIATLDFKSFYAPVDTFRPSRGDSRVWSPKTLMRTYILLRYKEHAQWYIESSRSTRQEWLKSLNNWGCWIKSDWEVDTGKRVVDTMMADRGVRIWIDGLPDVRRRDIWDLLQITTENIMFLLYFALRQNEELDDELRSLNAPRMPRKSLRELFADWRDKDDEKEKDERERDELAQTIHRYIKRRRIAD